MMLNPFVRSSKFGRGRGCRGIPWTRFFHTGREAAPADDATHVSGAATTGGLPVKALNVLAHPELGSYNHALADPARNVFRPPPDLAVFAQHA